MATEEARDHAIHIYIYIYLHMYIYIVYIKFFFTVAGYGKQGTE